jgi:hypothetical protein
MKLPIILYIIGSLFFLAGSITMLRYKPAAVIIRCTSTNIVDGNTYQCMLAAQHQFGHVYESKNLILAWTDK